MDGRAGMHSGKLKEKDTSRPRTPGTQAGKYNLKEEHFYIKMTFLRTKILIVEN
jgi:hypothetical protein